MQDIDHFNLRSFDLNLLIAFDAMMREKSVTLAAAKLKIQQPAMSHSLSTLRMLFEDELFVRVGNVMQPTSKAQAISAQINSALTEVQKVIAASHTFYPEQEEKSFTIGFSCEELLLLPDIVHAVTAAGQGLKVATSSVADDQIGRALDDGVIDVAIGCRLLPAGRHQRQALYRQNLVCCYNADLLKFSGGLTREEYLTARHAFPGQMDGLQGCLGSFLRESGILVDAAVAVPGYMSLLATVAKSPLLATLPANIADRYAGMFGLATCAAPLDVLLPAISMMWSARRSTDAANVWLRNQIVAVARFYENSAEEGQGRNLVCRMG